MGRGVSLPQLTRGSGPSAGVLQAPPTASRACRHPAEKRTWSVFTLKYPIASGASFRLLVVYVKNENNHILLPTVSLCNRGKNFNALEKVSGGFVAPRE